MRNKTILFGMLYSLLSVSGTLAESFPYHESFESGPGRWEPDETSDFDWSWRAGPTSSIGTGPSGAHDRDWYMYTEASFPNFPAKTTILQAEFDISSLAEPMMSFRYHLYGNSMGKLWVEVYDEQNGWMNVGSVFGETHNYYTDPWTRRDVYLLSYAGETSLKIRFRVETGNNYRSDICIDDIWLYDNDMVPDHFVWEAIGDQQTMGQAFPVQVEAVNSSGARLTSFNKAVELFAWSDGFANAIENGDFEEPLAPGYGWEPITGIFDGRQGWKTSVYGSGMALAFKRLEAVEDGIQQEVFLRGGERYEIRALTAWVNTSRVTITSDMACWINLDGIRISSSHTRPSLAVNVQSSALIYGYYTPAEDGTHTVQLVAKSSAGLNTDLYAYFDDVSVNFAPPQYIVADPGSGTFTNGVWSGTMVLNSRLPATRLIARYVDVMGASNPFSTYTSANDMDGDEMLDTWEVQYFGHIALCSPQEDSDGDGYSNLDEFFLGTIPTDINSSLNLAVVAGGVSGGGNLTWDSVGGHTYDVEWTPFLIPLSFTTITNIPHPVGSFTDDANGSGSQGYYRLKVRKE